jgi:hypothetical protein
MLKKILDERLGSLQYSEEILKKLTKVLDIDAEELENKLADLLLEVSKAREHYSVRDFGGVYDALTERCRGWNRTRRISKHSKLAWRRRRMLSRSFQTS